MSQHMSKCMSDHMSKHMSKCMSEHMSTHMSNTGSTVRAPPAARVGAAWAPSEQARLRPTFKQLKLFLNYRIPRSQNPRGAGLSSRREPRSLTISSACRSAECSSTTHCTTPARQAATRSLRTFQPSADLCFLENILGAHRAALRRCCTVP